MINMKKLIIARHGNTFRPNETPTRVGARTDLSLVEKEKSINIAKYLMNNGLYPNKIYSSPLKRTMETAEIIKQEMGFALDIAKAPEFKEIDYGPDENKTEDDVLLRLGKQYAREHNINEKEEHLLRQYGKDIIKDWDEKGSVPYDWEVDVPSITKSWKNLAHALDDDDIALVVTSNGIIRFAPYILNMAYEEFFKHNSIKVSTGGICIFENADNTGWNLLAWNVK
jgi:probable phosphoglycerate mutase